MYNMLAYNPGIADAFADAIGRLGANQVHMIVDQALTFMPNLIFYDMVETAVQKRRSEAKTDEKTKQNLAQWDDAFRWRIGLRAKEFEKSAPEKKGFFAWHKQKPKVTAASESPPYRRIDIAQQQHTKTIIVDDDTLFLGSANFDLISFGGSFREFSIAARTKTQDLARIQIDNAKNTFDAIWKNTAEAATTAKIKEINKEKIPSSAKIVLLREFLSGEFMLRRGLMPDGIPAGDESSCR
jgi:Phospholipase D Active site motif